MEKSTRKTVLIVDDEPVTRLNLSLMLSDAGYLVVGEGTDGFDAVELCREKRPDVVLMDLMMGAFDGLNAAEVICRNGLAGCVVMLTAFVDSQFIEKAKQVGVSGYLVKPVDQKHLIPTLALTIAQNERLLESRKRVRESEKAVEDSRSINRAKEILATSQGLAESDAYRLLQKMAMDKRVPMVELAEKLIAQVSGTETVRAAKQRLMEREGVSEKRAYKRLVGIAQIENQTIEEAARLVLHEKER